MKLARSSFYSKPKSRSPDRKKLETDLRDRIEAICLGFPRYGYRRVTWQLKREGKRINHKKVLRLMRESDLLCRVKRRKVPVSPLPGSGYKPAYESSHGYAPGLRCGSSA
jgi:transposase InsO family protein